MRAASASGKLAVAREPVAERRALGGGGDEVDDSLRLAAVAHRHDARIVERRHPLERLQHPLGRRERGETRGDDVHLHRLGVAPVPRREGEEHRALGNLLGDLVAFGEDPADLLQLVRGRGLRVVTARRGAAGRVGAGTGARRDVACAEPGDPLIHRRVGLGLQMLPHQRRVDAGELERAHPVARRRRAISINPSAARVLTGSAAASRRHQRAAAA